MRKTTVAWNPHKTAPKQLKCAEMSRSSVSIYFCVPITRLEKSRRQIPVSCSENKHVRLSGLKKVANLALAAKFRCQLSFSQECTVPIFQPQKHAPGGVFRKHVLCCLSLFSYCRKRAFEQAWAVAETVPPRTSLRKYQIPCARVLRYLNYSSRCTRSMLDSYQRILDLIAGIES